MDDPRRRAPRLRNLHAASRGREPEVLHDTLGRVDPRARHEWSGQRRRPARPGKRPHDLDWDDARQALAHPGRARRGRAR